MIWAAPWSLFGLLVGVLGMATGGGGRWVSKASQRPSSASCGIVEFWGGTTDWLLRHGPLIGGALAVTFGHVVLGRCPADLSRCRDHELVHVRQYERWGPFFVPAYLACSLWQWMIGRHYYLDNPFEVEAFGQSQ
jgi:hypothetical protein